MTPATNIASPTPIPIVINPVGPAPKMSPESGFHSQAQKRVLESPSAVELRAQTEKERCQIGESFSGSLMTAVTTDSPALILGSVWNVFLDNSRSALSRTMLHLGPIS